MEHQGAVDPEAGTFPSTRWPALLVPLLVVLVLTGSVLATSVLYVAARRAIDQVLHERLVAAGLSAAELIPGVGRSVSVDEEAASAFDARESSRLLTRLSEVNGLDGAYLVGEDLVILADAAGLATGRRANLLRVDLPRIEVALAGSPSVGEGYRVGTVQVITGYFPLPEREGEPPAVLVLEAGARFSAVRTALLPAFLLGFVLAVATALVLAAAVYKARRADRLRLRAEAMALRAQVLHDMSATAAHEIRNPLTVIRGTVELMRERGRATLNERDRHKPWTTSLTRSNDFVG